MAEFIVNARRAPRAPARCRADVVSTQGWFHAETEDVSATGCQVVSPKVVRKGDLVQLQIANPKLVEVLKVTGRVAWVSPIAPWRVGISFDPAAQPVAARWIELLVAALPGLGGYRRVPERIPAESVVYLGPPPRFLVDFSADEATLLRAIASGARVDELRARLRDRWGAAQRALFSLIARQAVTFQRGHAVHPDSWKSVLAEVEAALAAEALGREGPALISTPPPPPPMDAYRPARPLARELPKAPPPPPPRPTRQVQAWGEPRQPAPPLELPRDDGPPLATATPIPGTWATIRAGAGARATPVPSADFAGAGVGWRRTRARSAEAQAVYERAVEALQSGSVNGALGLFRRALALAPGDPEIAKALGELAFRDGSGAG